MSFWKTYTILPPKPQLFLIFYGKSTPATDSNWRAPGLRLVLAANTAHVLRLNKADVLALNKAHVLRLNTKICPVFTANAKETTKGGRPKAAPLCGFLCVGCEHWARLSVETQDMRLVESQDICLVETQDMCCVES